MVNRLTKGLLIAGCVAGAVGAAGCEVEVGHPYVEAGVGVDAGVVDVSPDVYLNYYDAPWSAGGYYVYRNDGGFYYLDRYHMGSHGERVFDRTYRVRRNMVHREFNAHEHEVRERPHDERR